MREQPSACTERLGEGKSFYPQSAGGLPCLTVKADPGRVIHHQNSGEKSKLKIPVLTDCTLTTGKGFFPGLIKEQKHI